MQIYEQTAVDLWLTVSLVDREFRYVRVKAQFNALQKHGVIDGDSSIQGGVCLSGQAAISGQELKLVWPQPTFDLAAIEASTEFQHYFLQPMDNAQQGSNIAACIAQCMQRPGWRLSLQTHKLTGIR